MSRPPLRRKASVTLVAALIAVAGCGVQEDSEPRALVPEEVPFNLLATSTTTTQPPPDVPRAPVAVFLVDNVTGQLVRVERPVPAPASAREALRELLEGPTEAELAAGLRSSVARSTRLLGIEGPVDGVVTVDLSDISGIAGQDQRLALAQVVFTLTAMPDINRVLFRFEGKLSEVPDGQGQSIGGPVGRSDFATFDPNAPTTTTARPPPPPPPPPPPAEPAG